jgi:hypothetical protein
VTGFPERKNDALFLIWFDFGKHIHLTGPLAQRVIAQLVKLGTGNKAWIKTVDLFGNVGGDVPVIPRDHFQSDAEIAQLLDGLSDPGLGWVSKDQKAQEGHIALIIFAKVPDGLGAAGDLAIGEAQRAKSLPAQLGEPPLNSFTPIGYACCRLTDKFDR